MEHFLLVMIISIGIGSFVGTVLDIIRSIIDDAIRKRRRKKEEKELQDKLDGILKDLDSIKGLK